MARGRITLYDVPPEVRAKGAADARRSILQMLATPHLTEEQKAELRERLKWTSKFESCNISEVLPEPQREPVHYKVDVVENLSVNES